MAKIFAYRGIIGMDSVVIDESAEDGFTISKAVINDVKDPNQMGVVCKASDCEISQEAIDLLKLVKKGNDGLGEIDIFGDKASFSICWLGGLKKMLDPTHEECTGSRDYDATLLDELTVVPNNPPQDFIDAIDEMKLAEVDEAVSV